MSFKANDPFRCNPSVLFWKNQFSQLWRSWWPIEKNTSVSGVMNSRVQKFGEVVMELIEGESNETRLIETQSAEFIQIMNFVKYRITCWHHLHAKAAGLIMFEHTKLWYLLLHSTLLAGGRQCWCEWCWMSVVTWSCPNKRQSLISAGVNLTSKDSCLLCLPGSVNYCVMSHYESEWGQVTWYYNQTKYSILHPTLRHWARLSCVQFISLSLVTGHHDDDQYSLRVHYFCSCSDYVNNKLVSTTNW